MTPERWRQIRGIFEQAAQCPAGERQCYLDQVRGEDATLAAEAADLLVHDARAFAEGFLSATCPVNVKAGLSVSAGADRLIGRRIGPFEIQQHIASGGMGDVYRAVRVEDYRRTVALKVIRNGLAGTELCERFRTERQVLAGLSHPNVVRLLHGGTTEDGLLYFVMEYIDGMSLDRWCAQRQPPLRERLLLLLAVARAVQYAHEQGVIHRDLKPGNVLVAADGTPKISDFGLAKYMDSAGPLDGGSQTRTGLILGSPSYLAPEQAGGPSRVMGPATDVYALGAILYELLTGRPPFKGVTLLDTLEQVRSAEPLSPRRLTPRLPRDLETICLKALAKNPAGRYATAAAFAADLERFLLGLPIEARPVNRAVKMARWCRHRPKVAALLAALVLVTTAGFAGVTWQWRRAEAHYANTEEQRRQAEQSFRQAHQVVADLHQLIFHDSLSGNPGVNSVRLLIAEEALTYYQEFLRQRGDDPMLQAEAAEASLHVANLYQMDPKQRHLAPAAYEKALALNRELLRQHPDDPACRIRYACSLTEAGHSQHQSGRTAEARRSLEQAIAILGPCRLDDPRMAITLAGCHYNLGILYHDGGRPAEALAWHQKVRVVSEKLVHDSPGEVNYRIMLARSLFHIARCQNQMGRPEEARHAFEESAVLWKQLAEEKPLQTSFRRDLAACYHGIGNLHRDAGANALAVQYFRQSLQIRAKLSRENPDYLPFLSDASGTEHRLGESLERLGRTEEALAAYQQALAQQRELVAKAPREETHQQRLGELQSAVARLSLRPASPAKAAISPLSEARPRPLPASR
jgi:eukaryotic-like serine/threonine-protein kinase